MSLGALLASFKGVRAAVLGDLMLDEYVFGTASRISPEAPVMVVRQERTRSVPGGAANVAKNVVALGGDVHVVGVVGDDEAGRALTEAIRSQDRTAASVIVDRSRVTTKKTRIVADHAHQVLRIDSESDAPVSEEVSNQLGEAVRKALEGSRVLVLSDYRKGALTDRVAREAIAAARAKNIPVVANPKPKSAGNYRGSQVVTLNRAEASRLLGSDVHDHETALGVAEKARALLGVEAVIVTLGAAGMVASTPGGDLRADPPKVEVSDVAGAGDTVAAAVALARAIGPLGQDAIQLAAEASARVVRHVGVAVPDERDLEEIRAL